VYTCSLHQLQFFCCYQELGYSIHCKHCFTDVGLCWLTAIQFHFCYVSVIIINYWYHCLPFILEDPKYYKCLVASSCHHSTTLASASSNTLRPSLTSTIACGMPKPSEYSTLEAQHCDRCSLVCRLYLMATYSLNP
jgi:hypothetical protein